ncbi:hypothetical protein LX16_3351 [Stackebrandtia albiflava]|uniref:GH26 domain-containing protein n=1 Tax=Stackebrandtia albiflava TaxID=406432 RepID=A0A562V3Y3_9ACTN|nr:DNRLRE domain-containing protein [Stackebrandtia albiflava]TWJ12590.1 hypothetical protein LX16_3351 [Stackebrandtia albiflava]
MVRIGRRRRIAIGAGAAAVVLAVVTAGYGLGLFGDGFVAEADENGAPARGDAYTVSGRPEANTGEATELHVGVSEAGVSVTYLRFAVADAGVPTAARLRLELVEPAGHGLLEVTQVDSGWTETAINLLEAPPFGKVLDTRRVSPETTTVAFDVTEAVVPGRTVAFAVTTPATGELWRLHSREADTGVPRLQLELPPQGARSPVPQPSSTTQPTVRPTVPPDGFDAESRATDQQAAAGCVTDALLVPTCGSLLGVAPGAHSREDKTKALLRFEADTGRHQHIYHGYHRGRGEVFPTAAEIALASDPEHPRVLFLNWKPAGASWAEIAAGDPATDEYLDELAAHIAENFDRPMFFTVHHEPEDDVRDREGSGYTADDYAAMYRHVVERLRAGGADRLVTVMVYMAYLKWTDMPWHSRLYPGDDVVDWVGWDTYGYSDPGHGHGDFAELVNRVSDADPDWPGFYNWAATTYPDKPLMIAEWGVWYSEDNPLHQAAVFEDAIAQMSHFPRLKAMVYFESENAEGRDSRVDVEPEGLDSYRRFVGSKHFAVDLRW